MFILIYDLSLLYAHFKTTTKTSWHTSLSTTLLFIKLSYIKENKARNIETKI